MAATMKEPGPTSPRGMAPVLGRALLPGLVLLGADGEPQWADGLALSLLGCRGLADLTARWTDIATAIGRCPASPDTPMDSVELAPDLTGGRRVQVSRV